MILTKLDKYRDIGLLILRVGIGIEFALFGYAKIKQGQSLWGQIGSAMDMLGIHFAPTFWGFMAAFAEFGGGILLILGLFFRPAAFLLTFTMAMAMAFHIRNGDGFNDWSHAMEAGVVFLSLILIGPGRYSLDSVLKPRRVRV